MGRRSMRRNIGLPQAWLAALLSATTVSAQVPGHAVETVAVSGGKIQGRVTREIGAWLGIPYGADTASRRFRPPLPATRWAGARITDRFGPKCPQAPLPLPPDLASIIQFADLPTSEDCLSLNVWSRASRKTGGGRPVLVWLHGGGFATGTGAEPHYEGANLARIGDVVVVTLNHRLNAFGFLDLSADPDPAYRNSANVGMLDIVLALEWVRRNIAAFGGDPANVTIFGQSGGGGKVGTLLAMPAARGLFAKAVIMSGPVTDLPTKEASRKTAVAVMQAAGVSRAAELAALPPDKLLAASARIAFQPSVDGEAIPRQPFTPNAPPIARHIPLMIGTTRDEATVFLAADPAFSTLDEAGLRQRAVAMLPPGQGERIVTAYRAAAPGDAAGLTLARIVTDQRFTIPSIQLADRKAAQVGAPVFLYRFDWRSPVLGGKLGATHGIDMAMWFRNEAEVSGFTGTGPEVGRIATAMGGALIAFARTGDPNGPGLPRWPRYDSERRPTMIFDTVPRVVADPNARERAVWAK
jgi:para-nitrobenzyl esterase